MPDAKITALTAISVIDPAVDPLPIVDVSDTAMAASGTTKKITINQILGASGTATLASATITGDLTVDTSTLKVDSANNRVGVGTASPTRALSVVGSAAATYANINSGDNTSLVGLLLGGTSTPSAGQVIYDNTANSLAFFTSGATQMTLNSSGLGLGVTPSAWNASFKGFDISTGGAIAGSSDSIRLFSNSAFNTAGNNVYKSTASAGRYDIQGNVHTWNIAPSGTAGTTITFTPAMTLDGSGNLILQSSATPATLTTNGQLTVNATSNTNLRFSYRGSDGVTRTTNLTLT